jgi:hypothetical protein
MWYFWQISGWYGCWSKAHYFDSPPNQRSAYTFCGRWVSPESGTDFVEEDENFREKRCRICWARLIRLNREK